MKVKYYEDADLLSIRVSKKLYYDAVQEGDVIVHYSQDKEPVLIEILNAARFLKDINKVSPKIFQRNASREVSGAIPHRVR